MAGVDDTSELLDYMVSAIGEGSVTSGTTLEVAFLGTQILKDEGRDALTAAVNAEQQTQQKTLQSESPTLTSVGLFLTVALCSAFVGLAVVVWRMRKRRQQQWTEEVVMAARSREMSIMEQSNNEQRHPYGIDGPADYEDLVSVDPENPDKYSFDMGDNMKSELFGIHGGASSRGRMMPPAPPSESSEDDSWAQADATLASLGMRSSRANLDEIGEI